MLLDDALQGNDFDTQRSQYLEVIDIARACDDHDLECDATASLGMMLVFSGQIDDGMAHLDEVLAAICGGDVAELPVVEGCLCGLLTACERTHDLGRADQWLRAAQAVMQRKNLVSVAGYCRSHYAGILIAAGRWDDAEDELTAVLDQLPDGVGVRAAARCRLAGLRVQQGRFEDADDLLADLDDHPDHVLPVAALLLSRDRPDPAIELLERSSNPASPTTTPDRCSRRSSKPTCPPETSMKPRKRRGFSLQSPPDRRRRSWPGSPHPHRLGYTTASTCPTRHAPMARSDQPFPTIRPDRRRGPGPPPTRAPDR